MTKYGDRFDQFCGRVKNFESFLPGCFPSQNQNQLSIVSKTKGLVINLFMI
jgi:hypothetical protein